VRLAWLEATDFRRYRDLRFEPAEGTNILIGSNGSGKSSVLEAIGYLATLASFRGTPDKAMVRQGAESMVCRGEFSSDTGMTLVEVETPVEGRRRVLMNGKGARSRGDVAAAVTLVAFQPDDLDLVKRGPANRRDYLDDLAVQLWPTAAAEQTDYQRVLRQRNAHLRQSGRRPDAATLDALDARLIPLGAAVVGRRLAAVRLAEPVVDRLYRELDDPPGSLTWRYEVAGQGAIDASGTADSVEPLLGEMVAGSRARDAERGMTLVGPHRDDLVFLLEGREARSMASQGEQRTITLGLRLAAHEVIATQRSTTPVLLLDDVFSELDEGRSERLMERLPGDQVFITSARPEEVPVEGTTWKVVDGKVLPGG
jgi:DNA replication and repair protein RecF